MQFRLDGTPVEFQPGDSIAVAIVRHGEHPQHGGTLCLAGDCGNCCAEVDGVAYTRTCLTAAVEAVDVRRHPRHGAPVMSFDSDGPPIRPARHRHVDAVSITPGGAIDPHAVVGLYPGPLVAWVGDGGLELVHAHRVEVTAGEAELHPVCDGNGLRGLFTAGARARLAAAGVDLADAVTIDLHDVLRFEGDGEWVTAVVHHDGRRVECRHAVVTASGSSPRTVLARMVHDPNVTAANGVGAADLLPPAPTDGTMCPCSNVTVADVQGVWDKGFRHLELVKRASLCGTGTCQGSVCVPHLRAFVAARSGAVPEPFTARPAVRQLTIGEAAAGVHLDAFRRTSLHDDHVALGGQMDRFGGWWRPWNYGDLLGEYWAVRTAVSLGDVSTLGKLVVSGPDAVDALERLYPTTIDDIRPGRSRYVLLLNERGHVIDDGMVCRESETRFVLTFTSGGAMFAEAWVRDWIETWGSRVHVMDRTLSLGAINVTGPRAAELLHRVGVTEPPRFLGHAYIDVAGVPCHVMRLSFTGEMSFELHHPVDASPQLWRVLMDAGADFGIRPHGLQALFGLRLEKGHVIVGMDTELDSTPRRLGMEWAVKMGKPDFVGRAALARTANLPDRRRLFAFTMDGEAPVEGTPISRDGDVVGHVTSSFTSPGLGRAVLLGWQKQLPFADEVTIDERLATVAHPPFYDREGHRARA
jgi:glycine cleavage system aminomethyltransferase T